MKKFFITLMVVFCATASVLAAATNKDIEKLRKGFADEYLSGTVNVDRVKELMQSIQADGTWAYINYVDTSRTAFQHSAHLSNMELMALAYKQKGSPLKGNKQLRQKTMAALDHWLAKDYICENWWWNQIGTPNAMIAMLYILDTDLSKAQGEKMLQIASRGNMSASGARPSGDRANVATIQAKYALWSRDEALVEESIAIIEGEAKFSDEVNPAVKVDNRFVAKYLGGGGSLQRDYSFHHRSDRVNNTSSYGMGPINAFVNWGIKLKDTKYRFSEQRTRLIIDYYLEGQVKQQVFGRITDPGVVNRDIARRRATGNGVIDVGIPMQLMQLSDYRKDELQQVVDARNGKLDGTPSYAKFFWQTEHFAIQRPTWYTSVRMFSTRNRNMEEPYNGEGLLNHYRADGTNYLSKTGEEYDQTAPVYDYRKIPGTTIVQGKDMPGENDIQKPGTMDFVGAVTDGLYGAVAFDFNSPHDKLQAKKGWFFFDDVYVCLGTDIKGTHAATTLNQCKLTGVVTVKDSQGQVVATAEGIHQLSDVAWVNHDNVGYVFMEKAARAGLVNNNVVGNWKRINRQSNVYDKDVHVKMFTLWMNHDGQPTYAYAVLPNASVQQTAAFAAAPAVTVVANTGMVQAVRNDKAGIAYAIFHSGGSVKLADGIDITSDTPGIVMVKYDGKKVSGITVEDPTRKLLKMYLTVNGKECAVELPQGFYAGQSKSVSF